MGNVLLKAVIVTGAILREEEWATECTLCIRHYAQSFTCIHKLTRQSILLRIYSRLSKHYTEYVTHTQRIEAILITQQS